MRSAPARKPSFLQRCLERRWSDELYNTIDGRRKENVKVLDVRDPDEYEIAHIKGVPQIPLGSLPQRFTELDPNQQIYLHCKSGVRSMKALKFLREQGFKYVKSVKGGISAWSDEIDHNVAKY